MLPRWPVDRTKIGILWTVAAALSFSAASFTLTRPPAPSGIHDSDSALYIVEAISLDQTSPWDSRPEWNTIVRVASLPWGGLHVVLLKLGLGLCGPSSNPCEFHAECLYSFWSGLAVASVLLAAVLGHLLQGPWGAAWASGLAALSVPHIKMYTQFNQLGSATFFSLLLLTVGAWRTVHLDRLAAAIGLGLVGFLHPFADNMAVLMWLSFPLYLWLALPHPDRRSFMRAVAPYAIGTSTAVALMAWLIGLRWITKATVYGCTLLQFVTRVASLAPRLAHPSGAAGPPGATLGASVSLLGAGGVLAVALAVIYGAARVRAGRGLCLAPVALAYALPMLFVPPDATVVTEYLQHGLHLLLLASGMVVAQLWSEAASGAAWVVPGRVAAVACLVLMVLSARGAARTARESAAGEAWASLGGKLARLPGDTVVASTIEEEVGILYSGRRVLARNDSQAAELAPLMEAWPGRIDYLVVRPSEQVQFGTLIDRRRLERIDAAVDGWRDEWIVFGLPGSALEAARTGAHGTNGACWRQPYIPYSFDAGWRLAPESILHTWGTAGLLLGDPGLWVEWSRATRLPYERFAEAGPPARPSPATSVSGRP